MFSLLKLQKFRTSYTSQSRQSAKRFSSRWNWDSPTPLAAGECAPPPFGTGGGHTRLRLKGWGSPNSDEWTYTVVLYIYKYFVIYLLWTYTLQSKSDICTPRKDCMASVPISTFMFLWAVYTYIPTITEKMDRPHKSLTEHEWRNWDRDHAVSYLGILFFWIFRYTVFAVQCISLHIYALSKDQNKLKSYLQSRKRGFLDQTPTAL